MTMAKESVPKFATWLLVAGLVFVGFAVVLGLNFSRFDGNVVRRAGRAGSGISAYLPKDHIEPSGGFRESSVALSDTGGTRHRLGPPFPEAGSGRSSSTAEREGQGKIALSSKSSETAPGQEDPNTVIGRQFPVSTSVERLCRKLSSKEEDRCAYTHRELEEFAQQPRDHGWASSMEGQLRALVISQSGYTIRTIECLTSLCVAEVASLYGMFHFVSAIGSHSPLRQSMMNGMEWQTAYEHDPSNGSVTVTLMIFERAW